MENRGIKIVLSHRLKEGMMGSVVYQGIDIETQKALFTKHLVLTTEDFAIFIGAVHGLMHEKKEMGNKTIYIPSKEIKDLILSRKIDIEYIKDSHSEVQKTNELVKKCVMWLLEQKNGINIDSYDIEKEEGVQSSEI